MTITPLPPAPNRTDPATFSDRADNFVAALPGFVSEANSQAVVVNQDAASAGTSASNAATSATASANSATASQSSATASANSATASQNSATASANSATASANSATASAASATAANTSADEAAASAASINLDSIAITGGTIDGTVIGGTTPAAISGTTGIFSNRVDADFFRSTTDGSAATPSIRPGLDNDTGMFRAANNEIGFSTTGVERLRINSTGNVGIGTSSPLSKLDVFGVGNTIRSTSNDGASNFMSFFDATGRKGFFGYGGGNEDMTVANERDGFLRFITNGSTRATITSAGNVGIGTSSPTSALTVQGTITGTAVTQNETDTTAGRLMKVRDFGLGGSSATGVRIIDDVNLQRPAGFYYQFSNAVNKFRGANATHIEVSGPSVDFSGQIAIAQSSNPEMGFRTRHLGSAGLWRTLFHDGNILGTVSQSGGVPTGAIIQRGSNANGEFVRFADGTQICDFSLAGSSTEAVTWTYPASFVAAPNVVGTARTATLPRIVVVAPLVTGAPFRVFTEAGSGSNVAVSLIAIGRWF